MNPTHGAARARSAGSVEEGGNGVHSGGPWGGLPFADWPARRLRGPGPVQKRHDGSAPAPETGRLRSDERDDGASDPSPCGPDREPISGEGAGGGGDPTPDPLRVPLLPSNDLADLRLTKREGRRSQTFVEKVCFRDPDGVRNREEKDHVRDKLL